MARIKKLIVLCVLIVMQQTLVCCIVLEHTVPQGSQGRIIGEEFESAISRTIVQHICQAMKSACAVRCFIMPGNQLSFYERLTLINQQRPMAFFALRCYELPKHAAWQINIYHYANNIFADRTSVSYQFSRLFIPVHELYKQWFAKSADMAQIIIKQLRLLLPYSAIEQPTCLPLSSLIGIDAAACLIEIGISNTQQVIPISQALAQSLYSLFNNYNPGTP